MVVRPPLDEVLALRRRALVEVPALVVLVKVRIPLDHRVGRVQASGEGVPSPPAPQVLGGEGVAELVSVDREAEAQPKPLQHVTGRQDFGGRRGLRLNPASGPITVCDFHNGFWIFSRDLTLPRRWPHSCPKTTKTGP